MGAREFHTDIFQQVAEQFGAPLFSSTTVNALWEELRFVVALNRIGGLLHLSNHHLGRYGVFLRSPFIVTVHDLMRYLDLTRNVEGDEPLIHRPNLKDRLTSGSTTWGYAGLCTSSPPRGTPRPAWWSTSASPRRR